MLTLDVLEEGVGEAAVPGAGVRQSGLRTRLARHQHRRGAALQPASTPTPATNIFKFFTLTQITVTCPLTLLWSQRRPPPRLLHPFSLD